MLVVNIVDPFNISDLKSSGKRVLFGDPLETAKSFPFLESQRGIFRVTIWDLDYCKSLGNFEVAILTNFSISDESPC
jgi:hypothetical protein